MIFVNDNEWIYPLLLRHSSSFPLIAQCWRPMAGCSELMIYLSPVRSILNKVYWFCSKAETAIQQFVQKHVLIVLSLNDELFEAVPFYLTCSGTIISFSSKPADIFRQCMKLMNEQDSLRAVPERFKNMRMAGWKPPNKFIYSADFNQKISYAYQSELSIRNAILKQIYYSFKQVTSLFFRPSHLKPVGIGSIGDVASGEASKFPKATSTSEHHCLHSF